MDSKSEAHYHIMKVAVVGATGLVGQTMIKVLEERDFPLDELMPVASENSVGKTILFKDKSYTTVSIDTAISMKPDLVLMSAGSAVSKMYAKSFNAVGAIVIDNSSAWRMDLNVPLVVPEVNGSSLVGNEMLIANPNCSTIILVVAMNEIRKNLGIRRMVVTTMQSVSGSGMKGITHWHQEMTTGVKGDFYPHHIDKNIIPQVDSFKEDGFTLEEAKLINETRKIFQDHHILIAPTCTRVPVAVGHSESVLVETFRPFEMYEIHAMFRRTPGVVLMDQPETSTYPTPLAIEGRDEVFVGRIRRDVTQAHGFHCWVVGDNIRKGAATNAVQIAELFVKKGRLKPISKRPA
jgi:aspartate-semialdehyde dehydrogenase